MQSQDCSSRFPVKEFSIINVDTYSAGHFHKGSGKGSGLAGEYMVRRDPEGVNYKFPLPVRAHRRKDLSR